MTTGKFQDMHCWKSIKHLFPISVSPNEMEEYDYVAENITNAEKTTANYFELVHGKKCTNDSDCAFTSYCEISIDSANSSSSDGKFTVSSIGYAKN